MSAHKNSEKFGYFAPPSWSKRLFDHIPQATKLNKYYGSATRRLAMLGVGEKFDLITKQCGKIRLYPKDNASDRWLIKGYPTVEAEELAAIHDVINGLNRPAVFYDIGANAGLYSLCLLESLRVVENAHELIVKAFEPNPTMISRLQENLDFNGADNVDVIPVGLSDQVATVKLDISKQKNLGAATLLDGHAESVSFIEIPTTTLSAFIEKQNIVPPDAMKLDIEGHEVTVLSAFFRDSPNIRPPVIICEMWSENSEALKSCLAKGGYYFVSKPGENAIFRHEGSE